MLGRKVTVLQSVIINIRYSHKLLAVLCHWIHITIAIAEKESGREILIYCFEPLSISNYSDKDSSSSKSKTDIRNFKE